MHCFQCIHCNQLFRRYIHAVKSYKTQNPTTQKNIRFPALKHVKIIEKGIKFLRTEHAKKILNLSALKHDTRKIDLHAPRLLNLITLNK